MRLRNRICSFTRPPLTSATSCPATLTCAANAPSITSAVRLPIALCPEIWYLLYGNHDFSDQQIRDRLWEILQLYQEGPQQLGEDEA